MDLNLTKCRHF